MKKLFSVAFLACIAVMAMAIGKLDRAAAAAQPSVQAEDEWVYYGEGTVSGDFLSTAFSVAKSDYTVKVYKSKANENLIRVEDALAGVYAAKGIEGPSPDFVFDVTDKSNVVLESTATSIEVNPGFGPASVSTMNKRYDFATPAEGPAEYRSTFAEGEGTATFTFPVMGLIFGDPIIPFQGGNMEETKISIELAPVVSEWEFYGDGTVSGDFLATAFSVNKSEYAVKVYKSNVNENLIRVENALAGVYAAKGIEGVSPDFIFDVTDKGNVVLEPTATAIEVNKGFGPASVSTMNKRYDFATPAEGPAEYRSTFAEGEGTATFTFPVMGLIFGDPIIPFQGGNMEEAKIEIKVNVPSEWDFYGDGTVSGDFLANAFSVNKSEYAVKVYKSNKNENLIRVENALAGVYAAKGIEGVSPDFIFDVTDKGNVVLEPTATAIEVNKGFGPASVSTMNKRYDFATPAEGPAEYRSTFTEGEGTATFTFPVMGLIFGDPIIPFQGGNMEEAKIEIKVNVPSEWDFYGDGTVSGDFLANAFSVNKSEYAVKVYKSNKNVNLIRVENALAGVYAAKGIEGVSPDFIFDVTDKGNIVLEPTATAIEVNKGFGPASVSTMNKRYDFATPADGPAEYRSTFAEGEGTATFTFPVMGLIFGDPIIPFQGGNMEEAKITIVRSAGGGDEPVPPTPVLPEPEILQTVRGDLQNWMKYLPDNMYVAHVSVPGTHDTATGHEWETAGGVSMSTTQNATIDEQLAGGIRAFDFRPGLKNGTDYLVCAHGIHFLNLRLDEAFKKITDFLDAHPSEFFVIHLFRGNVYRPGEGSNDSQEVRDLYNQLFDELFNKGDFSKYLVDYTPDLTVKETRGKIVVFRRDRIDFAHIEKAGNLAGWPSDKDQWNLNSYATAVNASAPSVRGNIYVTDVSSPKRNELELELSSIRDLYNFSSTQSTPNEERAKGPYRPYWVMCFTSGEYAGSGTSAYLNNAVETNPHLAKLINESMQRGPVGVVFSDWVLRDQHEYGGKTYNVKGNDIVKAVLENNFYYAENFTLDPSVFTPIEGTSNWDDTKSYFLKNVATGKLLSTGATWGTHAVLGDYGVRVTPLYDKFFNNYVFSTGHGNGYIGTDPERTFYVDYAPTSEFTLEKVEGSDDTYVFHVQLEGDKALTAEPVEGWADGTTYMVEPRAYEAGNALQQWQVIPVEEYLVSLAENLAEGESVDLSDYILGHHTWRNSPYNWTGTTSKLSSINHQGTDAWNDTDFLIHCATSEATSEADAALTAWSINKTVENLPAGSYTLKFLAAHRNLVSQEGFSFKVNDEELKSKIPTVRKGLAPEVIDLFRQLPDKYTVSHDFEIAENQPLNIELNNGQVTGETHLFLDKFVLLYHGKKNNSGVSITDEDNNGPVDIYTVSGILLRRQVERQNAFDGLASGIYIVRTATGAVKVVVE